MTNRNRQLDPSTFPAAFGGKPAFEASSPATLSTDRQFLTFIRSFNNNFGAFRFTQFFAAGFAGFVLGAAFFAFFFGKFAN